MITIYGNKELKVVRVFNEQKGHVEYDVMRYDGIFADEWFSIRPLKEGMSRKMADHLYQEALKPRILMEPEYDDE